MLVDAAAEVGLLPADDRAWTVTLGPQLKAFQNTPHGADLLNTRFSRGLIIEPTAKPRQVPSKRAPSTASRPNKAQLMISWGLSQRAGLLASRLGRLTYQAIA